MFPSCQRIQSNDTALHLRVRQGDLQISENRTRNHSHVCAPCEAIEVALGGRLIDYPRKECRQDYRTIWSEDEEREHSQSRLSELVVENRRRIRFTSGPEEHVTSAYKVSVG